MKFLKNLALGFYVSVLAVVAEIVGLVYYFQNQKTATYGNLALNMVTIWGGIIGIAFIAVLAVFSHMKAINSSIMRSLADIAYVAINVLFMCGVAVLIADRVNLFAGVLTFNKNPQTIADTRSAVIAIVAMLIAVLFTILASFMRMSKTEE
ncbi:hypothetical protein [Alloscardovia omnicolens]|uniref:hypothetical protein n=1 Tax=Alloscardovia omnicolens TaxID=419015 RepID=UPI003A694DA5